MTEPLTVQFDPATRACLVSFAVPDALRAVAPGDARRAEALLRRVPLDAAHLTVLTRPSLSERTVVRYDLRGEARGEPRTLSVQCVPGGFDVQHERGAVTLRVRVPLTLDAARVISRARTQ